jgi:AcrR family transcriptional regulator
VTTTDDTKQRIVDAVNALLVEESPAAISIPAVAQRAGVGIPTVYSHFPTKERLLDASAKSIDRRTNEWLGDDAPAPGEKLREYMHRSWHELAEHLPAVRASHRGGLGQELRQRRHDDRERRVIGAVRTAGIDTSTPDGKRLVRVLLSIASSSFLLEQVDRLGMSVDDAADDVVWALETLIAAMQDGEDRSD